MNKDQYKYLYKKKTYETAINYYDWFYLSYAV